MTGRFVGPDVAELTSVLPNGREIRRKAVVRPLFARCDALYDLEHNEGPAVVQVLGDPAGAIEVRR